MNENTKLLILRPAFLWMLAFLFSLSLSQHLQAQTGEGLSPMQVANIQQVGTAAVSFDGGYVAYTLLVPADPREENRPVQVQLHLLNVETGERRHLEMPQNATGVTFRPGHNTITFTTRMDGDATNAVYEVSPTGTDYNKLFQFQTNILGYEWSGDGTRLAFMANEPVDRQASQLPYEPEIYEENLVQRRAYVVDLTAGTPSARQVHADGSVYLLQWSPDGSRLALSAAPTPLIDDFYMFQQVRVVDAASLEVTHEIENEGKLAQIVWSPDGQRLALRAGDHIHDPIDGRIMVVSAQGGTPQNIYPGFEGKFEQIAWTGDDAIHFIASEGVWTSFGTIRPDGSGLTREVNTGGPILNAFSRAENGDVVFVTDTPQHPREVYALAPGTDTPRRLTHSNPWLDEVPLGRQEAVRFQARDGLEVEGLLIHPVDGHTAPHPVITVVHGGPEAHYSNGWLTAYSMPGQMGAARGYAVFYPNYRGSTGRGLEFTMSSQGDLAGAEFDDIVDGVDHLIEVGVADRDRIGVTGGSYGGYATAWMSTYYSDRFAAGVMFVGISNNISKWGTSDIPEELYLVHSRKRLWDHWEDNLRRSPIFYVNRAQTPLLIMHGKEDTRVHPGQAYEMYRHLRVRKPEVPVRLVLYPGEGHGNVRATSRFDYNLRMLQWFDAFLQGDGEMPPSQLDLEALEVAAGR